MVDHQTLDYKNMLIIFVNKTNELIIILKIIFTFVLLFKMYMKMTKDH